MAVEFLVLAAAARRGVRRPVGRLHAANLGAQVGASESGQAMTEDLLYGLVGFALLLPVALEGATLPKSLRWLGTRLMVLLGVLSYGIYLWPEGVIDLYRENRNEAPLHGWFAGILVVTVVVSVAVAGISYLVVERPALSLKDKRRRLFPARQPVGLPAHAERAPIYELYESCDSGAGAP